MFHNSYDYDNTQGPAWKVWSLCILFAGAYYLQVFPEVSSGEGQSVVILGCDAFESELQQRAVRHFLCGRFVSGRDALLLMPHAGPICYPARAVYSRLACTGPKCQWSATD